MPTTTPTTLRGRIVRQYVRERLLEVELEELGDGGSPSGTGRGQATSFVYVAACSRVLDASGRELTPRDGSSTWFAEDRGWTLVSIGRRVKFDHEGTREL